MSTSSSSRGTDPERAQTGLVLTHTLCAPKLSPLGAHLPTCPACRAYITQGLAINEFTGSSWDKPNPADPTNPQPLGIQVRGARSHLCRQQPRRRRHCAWHPPCCSAAAAAMQRRPTTAFTTPHAPGASHSLAPQVLEFRGFPTSYWWVWLGVGATIASTFINVGVFILAATFLQGAMRRLAGRWGWQD